MWRPLAAVLLWVVTDIACDASPLAHANHLVINGQTLTDPDPGDDATVLAYEPGDFDGWIIPVTVTDGTLTITAALGAFDPTLCFIEIGQAGQAITPDMQTRLADIVASATARTGGTPFWNGNRVETRTYVWCAYIDDLVTYQTLIGDRRQAAETQSSAEGRRDDTWMWG